MQLSHGLRISLRQGKASWHKNQGTKLGSWLFIVMIDELDIPNTELWKYVDDSTMSETVGRNQNSNMQTAVDTLVNRPATDKFQLN